MTAKMPLSVQYDGMAISSASLDQRRRLKYYMRLRDNSGLPLPWLSVTFQALSYRRQVRASKYSLRYAMGEIEARASYAPPEFITGSIAARLPAEDMIYFSATRKRSRCRAYEVGSRIPAGAEILILMR